MARAHAQAARPPATLGLVEAHGTGTVVGDRTEMATLTEIFGEDGASTAVVRARLGEVPDRPHQVRRRAWPGVIKAAPSRSTTACCPPTINLTSPNAAYDAKTSPFRFLDRGPPVARGRPPAPA